MKKITATQLMVAAWIAFDVAYYWTKSTDAKSYFIWEWEQQDISLFIFMTCMVGAVAYFFGKLVDSGR